MLLQGFVWPEEISKNLVHNNHDRTLIIVLSCMILFKLWVLKNVPIFPKQRLQKLLCFLVSYMWQLQTGCEREKLPKEKLVSSLEQIIYNNNERGKGSNSVGQNRNCLINQQEEQWLIISLNMVYQISHERHNLTFLWYCYR